jgi:hypothetical protein
LLIHRSLHSRSLRKPLVSVIIEPSYLVFHLSLHEFVARETCARNQTQPIV